MQVNINDILTRTDLFLGYILLSIFFTLILGVVLKFTTNKFSLSNANLPLYGYFINMSNTGLAQTSIVISRMLLVLSVFLFDMDTTPIILMYFLVTGVLYNLSGLRIKGLLLDGVNSFAIYILLFASEIVQNYIFKVDAEINNIMIYLTLIVFIILYQLIISVYYIYLILIKTTRNERLY